MKKRIFSFLLALCMVLSMLPAQANAAEATVTPAVNSDGYYEIGTADELLWFSQQVNSSSSNRGLNAVLTASIDLSGICGADIGNWTPIGNSYSGHFNGQNHTISGLYMTGNDQYIGLFGYVDGATIENMTVTGSISSTFSITWDENYNYFYGAAGGIVAYLNGGTICNCHVDMTVKGELYIGGICGKIDSAYGGLIENCTSRGTVECPGASTASGQSIGGIVGINWGTVRDCTNEATVTNQQQAKYYHAYMGGIAGASDGTIESCTNYGSIVGNSDALAGGIVGNQSWYGVIRNCGNLGAVSGEYAGGVIGDNLGCVENCYNAGSISATNDSTDYVAPVANSRGDDASVTNCYYLSDEATEDGGRTAAQFASGQVAYELNGSTTTDASVWRQTLGTDAYPVLSGALVYYNTWFYCDDAETSHTEYSNTQRAVVHTGTEQKLIANNDGTHNVLWNCCNAVATENVACTYNENNTCACGYTAPVTDPVAEVGGTQYATLLEAVNAAQAGETIKLVADIEITAATTFEMAEGVTLDLNGYTMKGDNGKAIFTGKNITIKNGKVTGYNGSTLDYYPITIDGGSATLEGLTFVSGGVKIRNSAVVTLKDCSITANQNKYKYAVWAYGKAKVTIESGTYFGGKNGYDVFAEGGAKINVLGGTYKYKNIQNYIPTGAELELVKNENGSYTVAASVPVAMVDYGSYGGGDTPNTYHKTLQEAINAAKYTSTVYLLSDIEIDEQILINESIGLSLGDYTITSTHAEAAVRIVADKAIEVMILTNETLNGRGGINAAGACIWSGNIENEDAKTTLYIGDGNYVSASATAVQQDNGTCTIYGGTFKANGQSDIANGEPVYNTLVLNNKDWYMGEFVINGGSFYGFNPACMSINKGDHHDHDSIQSGYVGVLGEDGWFTVAEGTLKYEIICDCKYPASAHQHCYASFEDALAAYEKNDCQWDKIVPITDLANTGILHVGTGENKDKVIVIDAGHQIEANTDTEPNGPGSTTMKTKVASGTYGRFTGVKEYQLNLEVAIALRDELLRRGYTVVMVRESNEVDISNAERAQIANAWGADALIRIHANGSDNANTSGAEGLCQTANNPYSGCAAVYNESLALTDSILGAYCKETGMTRRYIWKTDTMTGINWANVPATILELGYMTNEADDTYMATDAFKTLAAEGIANGLDAYFAD